MSASRLPPTLPFAAGSTAARGGNVQGAANPEPRAADGESPRVLIVRLSAVGDCVQTLPLASAVRERFPNAHITWVVERFSASIIKAVPAIDRVIELPKRFAYSLSTLRRLRKLLRQEQFTLALDPQGLTKSGLVSWLSGAPRRIGFARPVGREIDPWLQTELVTSRAVHMVDRYLELLKPLGVESPPVHFGLQIPQAAQQAAHLISSRPEFQSGYAVLNPGAGWESKRWPVHRFVEVARHLAKRGLQSLVTWGGSYEQAWAEAIARDSTGIAHAAPRTSLLELAALIQGAQLFVGSDTGPLHLAAAVGTRCIGMFGPSPGAACGPYGVGHVVLQAAFDGSRARRKRGADNWAMRRITVDMVAEACDELLGHTAAPQGVDSRAA